MLMDEICYVCNRANGRLFHRDTGLKWCAKCAQFSNNLKQNYGITIDDYKTMLKRQHDRCAICKALANECRLPGPIERYGLVVDHCHETNTVRGLLCNHCNRMLGASRDSIATLWK